MKIRSTTVLCVRRDGRVAMGCDGQVTVGTTVMKHNAMKIRCLHHDQILAGFAAATADAFTLFEKFEGKLEEYRGNLTRAAVELAKDWRTDHVLRHDAKKLYSDFNLSDPATSVSMTINGPSAIVAAFFMNAAIDQQCELYIREHGLEAEVEKNIKSIYQGREALRPRYFNNSLSENQDQLPEGNNGLGLMLLGVTGDQVLDKTIYETIKANTLKQVGGTVQPDILKEDQAQNSCIFSTEFSLKLMGDEQQYFIHQGVRNFYSVSISGYHIAEAGANPISQLAFTISNAFTFVEYYLSRGMRIDDFAPNLSFFFSNGIDPEYSVIGRVARRICFSLGVVLAPQDWSGLSLAVGVAVAGALHPALQIKWPNDLWLHERKLAGILIETAQVGGQRLAVIGIGINLEPPPADLLAGLSVPPSGLRAVCPDDSAPQVLLRVLPALLAALRQFEAGGLVPFLEAYRARDLLQGRAVLLSDGTQGTAQGIDAGGGLLVHTPAGMRTITSSEVSVRPVAPAAGRGA